MQSSASRFADSAFGIAPQGGAGATNTNNVNNYHAKRRNQSNRYEPTSKDMAAANNSPDPLVAVGGGPSWEGKCIHIVLELAECGDVQ